MVSGYRPTCSYGLWAPLLAPDCAPLFLIDGFREYMTALLTHYGQWVHPQRRQGKGPAPKPRWMPRPTLLYAQVVKTRRRRRLVRVSHRVVFGTLEAVQQVLAAHGWQINTAFVERVNLSIRQHVAAVGRRVNTLSPRSRGCGTRQCILPCCRSLIPGRITAYGLPDEQMLALDALDVELLVCSRAPWTSITGAQSATTTAAVGVAVGPVCPGMGWGGSRRDRRSCRGITAATSTPPPCASPLPPAVRVSPALPA